MESSDWRGWFHAGESPYFAMYRAGIHGIPIEEVSSWCLSLGIPLRDKDVRNWKDGRWSYDCKRQQSVLNPILMSRHAPAAPFLESKLTDFPRLPEDWMGTDRRWFPCTAENKPMAKWGYAEDYVPVLYDQASAKALAPTGYVGQNLYAQPLVVIDIDGVGHGEPDGMTIQFGRQFDTETYENPAKPGSFHLYFWTDRLLPIQHWPFAHIDFMGNARNAAVYMKEKQGNGMPRMFFSQQVLETVQGYIKLRRLGRSRA